MPDTMLGTRKYGKQDKCVFWPHVIHGQVDNSVRYLWIFLTWFTLYVFMGIRKEELEDLHQKYLGLTNSSAMYYAISSLAN